MYIYSFNTHNAEYICKHASIINHINKNNCRICVWCCLRATLVTNGKYWNKHFFVVFQILYYLLTIFVTMSRAVTRNWVHVQNIWKDFFWPWQKYNFLNRERDVKENDILVVQFLFSTPQPVFLRGTMRRVCLKSQNPAE